MIKVTEKNIQALLMRFVMQSAGHLAALPNPTPGGSVRLTDWEADLLTINRSGYSNEYEIKISPADYRKDVKKTIKMETLLRAYVGSCSNKKNIESDGVPNYFWYVTYEFEIEPPKFAGWILVRQTEHSDHFRLDIDIRKKAPRLHISKKGEENIKHIAKLLSYRLDHAYRMIYTIVEDK